MYLLVDWCNVRSRTWSCNSINPQLCLSPCLAACIVLVWYVCFDKGEYLALGTINLSSTISITPLVILLLNIQYQNWQFTFGTIEARAIACFNTGQLVFKIQTYESRRLVTVCVSYMFVRTEIATYMLYLNAILQDKLPAVSLYWSQI